MAAKGLEEILKELDRLGQEAESLFARVESSADLEKIRVEWLGKKSPLAGVMREMGALSPEDRPKGPNSTRSARRSANARWPPSSKPIAWT